MTSVPIQGEAEAPSKFWVLLTASLVSSLIMLDSNVVAVSLPAIGRSLGASFTDVQWVSAPLPHLRLAAAGVRRIRRPAWRQEIYAHRLGHFCRCIRRLRLGDELTVTEFGSRYARCGRGFPCHRIPCHPDERVTGAERNQAFAFWARASGSPSPLAPSSEAQSRISWGGAGRSW